MKEEIAMMWADALESGKYKQGRGQLRGNNDDYCCLGVLCDLSGLGVWETPEYTGQYMRFAHSETSRETAFLTDEVQNWAEMKDFAGSLPDSISLASENDQGRTFTEIAAIIRDNWKDL